MRGAALLDGIELVTLSVWLGAALLVAAVVAPAAFAVLPSRALAGALVGRVLPVIFAAGIVAAMIGAGCAIGSSGQYFTWRRMIPLIVVAASCAVAQFVVTPRLDAIRRAIPGAVEALSPTDPRRVMFGRLHAISVLWLGIAMVGATIAVVLRLLALRSSSPVLR